MILYIDDKRCDSLVELKHCFRNEISYDNAIFWDLLDYGRRGNISTWLREKKEYDLASQIDSIDNILGDSEYVERLSELLTSNTIDVKSKPTFKSSCILKDVKLEIIDERINIKLHIKANEYINERFTLKVSLSSNCNFLQFNPADYATNSEFIIHCSFQNQLLSNFSDLSISENNQSVMEDTESYSFSKMISVNINGCSFNMIKIKSGSFMMGVHDNQEDIEQLATPLHEVLLTDDFWMSETLVSQELWGKVMFVELENSIMGENPSMIKSMNNPVEMVSWYDCIDFIDKLNLKTKMTFSLPTEAEWEFAARGGILGKGYKYSGSNKIGLVAWYSGNSDSPKPVAQKHANELGIFDMTGNVWEWCQDWFCNYQQGNEKNPNGPSDGEKKIRRGGSFINDAKFCYTSTRGCDYPWDRGNGIGFRLVLKTDRKIH